MGSPFLYHGLETVSRQKPGVIDHTHRANHEGSHHPQQQNVTGRSVQRREELLGFDEQWDAAPVRGASVRHPE